MTGSACYLDRMSHLLKANHCVCLTIVGLLFRGMLDI